MSADNRSVSTDALGTLGTIIESGGRDAIHLAVEPTVCKELSLRPGQHVGADGSAMEPWVGIVDPFLSRPVKKGEMFWLVLYPRTISSLRHVWEHPAFPSERDKELATAAAKQLSGQDIEESEEWLRDFVKREDLPGYDEMMRALARATEDPCFDRDGNANIPAEFWKHYETVTGRKVARGERGQFFRCAC